ncbi:hypothetical protein [Acrocarpospora sp. B8E8]|uniref:hypothetical protein n=1 Tax=Acrocarpospora sp. B8E8 TaxID=3153572 RepID=UPI00325D2C4A
MTIYVVPCGLSVLKGWDQRAALPGAKAGRFVEALGVWAQRTPLTGADPDRLADHDVIDSARRALGSAVPDAGLPRWPADICAETGTLHAKGLRRLTGGDDRVVLLASDTRTGISAALCVALLLGDERVAYVSAPAGDGEVAGFRGRLRPGTATVVRIPGLPQDLNGAVGAIGRVLRAVHEVDEDLQVHLTGGYKATLLHTLAMTEIVYSQAPERTSAWYTFEGNASGATRIGLRRFPKGYLDVMRAELSRVKQGLKPQRGPEAFQAEVAWERYGSGYRLNDFGRGYLAVLGEIPGSNDGSP